MNKAYLEDLTNGVKRTTVGDKQLLDPGSTGRRYEPDCGVSKHNARIHRESDVVDKYGNLPFSFSKPKRAKRRKLVKCSNCGDPKWVNNDTVGVICSSCHTYSSVKEVQDV